MKKKLLALILALSMAVSLVSPAVATGTEGEPTPAETVQTLLSGLSELYEEKSYEDAGLILAALAQDEEGNLPEDPVLPEDYTLPDLTDSLDQTLNTLFTADQVASLQSVLDEETQPDSEPIKEAVDWTLQELFNGLFIRHGNAVSEENFEGIVGVLAALTLEKPCDVCGQENCEAEHVQCEVCSSYDCVAEHVYCDVCEDYDCGQTHEDLGEGPEPEVKPCEVCGVENCETQHVY